MDRDWLLSLGMMKGHSWMKFKASSGFMTSVIIQLMKEEGRLEGWGLD